MNIKECLEKLCEHADKALDVVNSSTHRLFLMLAEDAKRNKFELSPRHQELIDHIKHHGEISDSASFIQEKILDSEGAGAKLIDIDLTRIEKSIDNLNSVILDVISEYNKVNRAFVYFAWRSKPEEYCYIGKAGSKARINLINHGKLLESLKEATRLSFIFPAVSIDEYISNLEAALLNLVEFKFGLPVNNRRRETFFFNYECGEELQAIRRLISKVHKQLE